MVRTFFFFFFHTHLLSSFRTSRGHRCRPFFPPVLAFNFYRAYGSAIPLLDDLSSSVANSRSRAFGNSICAQAKVPTNLYEYALGGIRTHDTDLYQARAYSNLVRHRGDRLLCTAAFTLRHVLTTPLQREKLSQIRPL